MSAEQISGFIATFEVTALIDMAEEQAKVPLTGKGPTIVKSVAAKQRPPK